MSDNSSLIASALEGSNPELALTMDARSAFKADITQQGARVALYRNYERGDHRSVITTQMKKMLRLIDDASGLTDFNGNYCGIVIDKMAGRLHVSEITTGDPQTDDDWLVPILVHNDFDNLQSTTFRGAIRDADSYIMVDPLTLDWTAESAYDGYSGIVAIFEPGMRTPVWACKIWSEADGLAVDNTMRLIVYQPDSVSYWRGQEGGSEVMPDTVVSSVSENDDGEQRVSEGNTMPFPVGKTPIVHFVNRYENYSEMGESEIRAAVPLQDVYNRTLHTMSYASENSGYTKPWSKGMELSVDGMVPGAVINLTLKDANGVVINEPTPEMLAFLQSVEIGQLEATDITQFLAFQDWIVRQVSQVTQTPIYGVTADGNLSGEALKQLEIGLIGKIIRFQQQNTDSIRELIELTSEIQNAFNTGQGSAPEIDSISMSWKNPEILDAVSQIAALSAMRMSAAGLWSDDFYRARIGGMLGMSQREIQDEADAVKKQKAEQLRSRVNAIRVPVPPANDGQEIASQ